MARSAPAPAVIAINSVSTEDEVNAKTNKIRDTKSLRKEKFSIEIFTSPAHKLMTIINSETSSILVNLFVKPRTISASKIIIAEYIYKTPKMMFTAESTIELP